VKKGEGGVVTNEILHANLHAGVRWSKARDLPDVVGWRDLTFAADLAVGVMRDRIDSRAAPSRVHSLPLPKGYGPELRQMALFDPYDEVIYRSLVGLAADQNGSSLPLVSWRATYKVFRPRKAITSNATMRI
jgi:hypothetical protein